MPDTPPKSIRLSHQRKTYQWYANTLQCSFDDAKQLGKESCHQLLTQLQDNAKGQKDVLDPENPFDHELFDDQTRMNATLLLNQIFQKLHEVFHNPDLSEYQRYHIMIKIVALILQKGA